MDFNKVILVGRVVHAVKRLALPSGDMMVRFSLATNSISRDPQTMATRRTVDYHEICAFGRLVEVAVKFLGRGAHVLVEGRLHNREYVGKAGTKVRRTEIVLTQIVVLDRKSTKDDATREVQSAGAAEPA